MVNILLDSEEYRLARQKTLDIVGPTARRWSMEKLPIATQIEQRPDVRPGAIPNEFIITWDDWSKGICGDKENISGCHHLCLNVDPTTPGSILSTAGPTHHTTSTALPNVGTIIAYKGLIFLFQGQYAFTFHTASWVTDKDFGSGSAIGAAVHNDELIVAMGESTKIWKRNASATWTEASDNTYVSKFTSVQDRLWRAAATNEVSNIGPTDDPLTLANWSSGISVGDDDNAISKLGTVGNRLVVSKQTGLYIGDEAAVFPNVFPQFENMIERLTGGNTITRGADIFFPHRGGLIRYTAGQGEEIGLQKSMPSINLNTTNPIAPGLRISSMATDGYNIWVATRPSYLKMADPYIKKTVDNGSSYTTYTTEAGDNDLSTVVDIGDLDTVANGDWLLIGCSSVFYATFFLMQFANVNGLVVTAHYWNGSSWATFVTSQVPNDETIVPWSDTSFSQSGVISLQDKAPTDWAQSTIDGQAAYWTRFSVGSAISSTATVSEIRVVIDSPTHYFFRGRPRKQGDVRSQSIIWESIFEVSDQNEQGEVQRMFVNTLWPYAVTPSLIAAIRQNIITFPLTMGHSEKAMNSATGYMYFAKHDCGMPEVNKEFLSFTIKGRRIDATHVVGIHYKLDDVDTLRIADASISSSPTTITLSTDKSGYSIQPRIALNAVANDLPTEVNQIECRFRVLPTYKNHYRAVLELADGQVSSDNSGMPTASVQKATLEALVGAIGKTLVDPTGTSKTINVTSYQEIEYIQEGLEYPVLLVELKMTEV